GGERVGMRGGIEFPIIASIPLTRIAPQSDLSPTGRGESERPPRWMRGSSACDPRLGRLILRTFSARNAAMNHITNQPPPLEPYNLLQTDRVFGAALVRENAGWAGDELNALGSTLGAAETIRLGFAPNDNPPVLRGYDRYGDRIDEVEFDPAWHTLLSLAVGAGLHASPWA